VRALFMSTVITLSLAAITTTGNAQWRHGGGHYGGAGGNYGGYAGHYGEGGGNYGGASSKDDANSNPCQTYLVAGDPRGYRICMQQIGSE
jgi:hypothetical protein